MLESLIGPLIEQLLKFGMAAYKEQQGENAIRKAEAYGRALDAWQDVTRIESEYEPVLVFRVRDGTGPGEVSHRPGA